MLSIVAACKYLFVRLGHIRSSPKFLKKLHHFSFKCFAVLLVQDLMQVTPFCLRFLLVYDFPFLISNSSIKHKITV